MNLFLLLLQPAGEQLGPIDRSKYTGAQHRVETTLSWHDAGNALALIGTNGTEVGPSLTSWGSWIGAGAVRLDNRSEVASWVGGENREATDLEIILRLIAAHGESCVPKILGDFAFVAWNRISRRLVAARDALGVKRIYYRTLPRLIAFGSRPELVAPGEEYDLRTLTEHVAVCIPSPDRTAFAGVAALPPGSIAISSGHHIAVTRFWSPAQFEPASGASMRDGEYSAVFRQLFSEAVRQCLTGSPDVWSQLSGGLDSSSVVSMAQWLTRMGEVPCGIAGSLSWVYRWSKDGDERAYSEVVSEHSGVPNKTLLDGWFWKQDGEAPPATDEPSADYAMYARERQTCRVIREAGGRVLLTGFGSDHYLLGNMFFFADWIARGRVGVALREMARRAAIGHASFWTLAYQNAVLPLLPRTVQQFLVPGWKPPDWVRPELVRRFGMEDQRWEALIYAGRFGKKYAGVVLQQLRHLPFGLARHHVLEDQLDVRHPFLYRPLVEFGLQLPPEMCVQPHARKWVLRQAMRGILPEVIRTRVGKGSNFGCSVQSLRREREQFETMLADPLVAQLGCVEPKKLRAGYEAACKHGTEELVGAVFAALTVETWLRVRTGQWVRSGVRDSHEAVQGCVGAV